MNTMNENRHIDYLTPEQKAFLADWIDRVAERKPGWSHYECAQDLGRHLRSILSLPLEKWPVEKSQ